MSFVERLNITYLSQAADCVEAVTPVDDGVKQPFGYLHGGATIALLETRASQGAVLSCADGQKPFAVDVHVAHRSSMRDGSVYACGRLAKTQTTSKGYAKQTWEVCACAQDAHGPVVSEGTVICLLVP